MPTEIELAKMENERLRAENIDLRSHYVHISVVADMIGALKEAKQQLDQFTNFLKMIDQIDHYKAWSIGMEEKSNG